MYHKVNVHIPDAYKAYPTKKWLKNKFDKEFHTGRYLHPCTFQKSQTQSIPSCNFEGREELKAH